MIMTLPFLTPSIVPALGVGIGATLVQVFVLKSKTSVPATIPPNPPLVFLPLATISLLPTTAALK